MKGTYKVYDSEQREWKELPLFFKGDSVKLKIENDHLYASYDEEKT
jgi:hypothetical protein